MNNEKVLKKSLVSNSVKIGDNCGSVSGSYSYKTGDNNCGGIYSYKDFYDGNFTISQPPQKLNGIKINAEDIELNVKDIKINGKSVAEKWLELTGRKWLKEETETENETEHKLENEGEKMNFNFDFGSCANNHAIRMSMYGLAVKNKDGEWVSYDKNTASVVNVNEFSFDGMSGMFYKMPVALGSVNVGNTIVHNHQPVFVESVKKSKKKGAELVVVEPATGEKKTILPETNMFNFNFVTKIVSLMEMCGGSFELTADEDNPFGNMLPMMMLADGGNASDMMLMMMLMNGNGNGCNFNMNNPMFMYALMNSKSDKYGSNKADNMLPLLMAMNLNAPLTGNGFDAPAEKDKNTKK